MNIKAKLFTKGVSGKQLAYGSITIDDSFVVTSIKVMQGKEPFVAFPSYKKKDGTYADICFPVTKEARQQINDAVVSEYRKLSGENQDVEGFVEVDSDFDSSEIPF